MKNRSRRTSRRQTKRIEQKRERAADRQALSGGHSRVVHRYSWSSRPHQSETLDEDARPAKKPKEQKVSRRPEKCPKHPQQRTHQWLKDWEWQPIQGYVWNEEREDWIYKEVGRRKRHFKLCGWCGQEKTMRLAEREMYYNKNEWTVYPRQWMPRYYG
jgi:hypothetical protein